MQPSIQPHIRPSRAFREGYLASLDGEAFWSNPYKLSINGWAWMEGWTRGSEYLQKIING